jgi:hypothetical protein
MSLNPYFKNLNNCPSEQELLDDLYAEAICQYGVTTYYIPRTLVNEDFLFGEDTISSFESSYEVEMYIETADGFEGDGDLMSKFGMYVKDRCTFDVSRPKFKEYTGMEKPLEGDLIWLPMAKALLEVKFVEDEKSFYQLGSLHNFKIDTQLFEYSREDFSTDVEVIDGLGDILDDTGYGTDPWSTNDELEAEGDEIIDITEKNVFGEF